MVVTVESDETPRTHRVWVPGVNNKGQRSDDQVYSLWTGSCLNYAIAQSTVNKSDFSGIGWNFDMEWDTSFMIGDFYQLLYNNDSKRNIKDHLGKWFEFIYGTFSSSHELTEQNKPTAIKMQRKNKFKFSNSSFSSSRSSNEIDFYECHQTDFETVCNSDFKKIS